MWIYALPSLNVLNFKSKIGLQALEPMIKRASASHSPSVSAGRNARAWQPKTSRVAGSPLWPLHAGLQPHIPELEQVRAWGSLRFGALPNPLITLVEIKLPRPREPNARSPPEGLKLKSPQNTAARHDKLGAGKYQQKPVIGGHTLCCSIWWFVWMA